MWAKMVCFVVKKQKSLFQGDVLVRDQHKDVYNAWFSQFGEQKLTVSRVLAHTISVFIFLKHELV